MTSHVQVLSEGLWGPFFYVFRSFFMFFHAGVTFGIPRESGAITVQIPTSWWEIIKKVKRVLPPEGL